MEKQFAVAFFPDEEIYSELPVLWLTPTKKHCWWPNSMNVSHAMARQDKPNCEKWKYYKIEIDSYCCKYP